MIKLTNSIPGMIFFTELISSTIIKKIRKSAKNELKRIILNSLRTKIISKVEDFKDFD